MLAYVVRVTTTTAGVAVSGAPHRAPLPFGPAPDGRARPAGRSLPSLPAAKPALAAAEPAPPAAGPTLTVAEPAPSTANRLVLGAAGVPACPADDAGQRAW
jgi:hypothetical protein